MQTRENVIDFKISLCLEDTISANENNFNKMQAQTAFISLQLTLSVCEKMAIHIT